MNVYIRDRKTGQPVVRYEVHLARGETVPPDEDYFDEAWRRALADGMVGPDRNGYEFQLQKPYSLYESSR